MYCSIYNYYSFLLELIEQDFCIVEKISDFCNDIKNECE